MDISIYNIKKIKEHTQELIESKTDEKQFLKHIAIITETKIINLSLYAKNIGFLEIEKRK